MASDAKFVVEYAKTARATCKEKKECPTHTIEKGTLRIGKVYASDRFTEGGEQTEWYHPACIFANLKRTRPATRKIESVDDLEGFGSLSAGDQDMLRALVADAVPQYKRPGDKPSRKAPQSHPQQAATTRASPGGQQPLHFGGAAPRPSAVDAAQLPAASRPPAAAERHYVVVTETGAQVVVPPGVSDIGTPPARARATLGERRKQIEFRAQADGRAFITARGANPSCFFGEGRAPVVMKPGVEYAVSDGDQFTLLADKYPCTVHVRSGPPPCAASAAKRPQPDARPPPDSEPPAKAPRLDAQPQQSPQPPQSPQPQQSQQQQQQQPQHSQQQQQEGGNGAADTGADDNDDPRPLCKYGAACYRKNPQHIAEFRHK
eukprot:m51a1_g13705 putative dna ligase 3-like (376) ;mRNA; r:76489-77931